MVFYASNKRIKNNTIVDKFKIPINYLYNLTIAKTNKYMKRFDQNRSGQLGQNDEHLHTRLE